MNLVQATYRPAPRAPASWFSPGATAQVVPVPGHDEDELTLALAAIEPVLARAHLAPAQLRRVAVSSRTASGFGPMLAVALGIPSERVEEGTAILYGATQHAAPGEGPVLQVQSDAPRPGKVPKDGIGAGAYATARLSGPAAPDGGDFEVPTTPRDLARDVVDLLAHWEAEATKRVTMGAYIPKGTWDRGAGARYRLDAGKCTNGHVEFPPRTLCGRCGGASSPAPLPREGALETFTVVAKGAGPTEFEPLQAIVGEYAVGIARFGEARVPGIFVETDTRALRVGMRVGTTLRRLYGQDGDWRHGLKFRPLP